MTLTLPNGPEADSPSQTRSSTGRRDRDLLSEPTVTAPLVADLMRPCDPIIAATLSMRRAAEIICLCDEAFAAVELNGEVIGILSAEDIVHAAQHNATGWQTQPCASGISTDQAALAPHHSVAEVLAEYRTGGIRPLLVCHRNTAVGMLRPAEVRRWCQDHDHLLWEDLFSDKEVRRHVTEEVDAR